MPALSCPSDFQLGSPNVLGLGPWVAYEVQTTREEKAASLTAGSGLEQVPRDAAVLEVDVTFTYDRIAPSKFNSL